MSQQTAGCITQRDVTQDVTQRDNGGPSIRQCPLGGLILETIQAAGPPQAPGHNLLAQHSPEGSGHVGGWLGKK